MCHLKAPIQTARRNWLVHAAALGVSPWARGVSGTAAALALSPAALAQGAATEPRQLVERWRQALVTVEYTGAARPVAPRTTSGSPPAQDPPEIRAFLDRFLGPGQGNLRPLAAGEPSVLNSGALISPDGWVMSLGIEPPAHGEQATVRTDDGRAWPARYVGGDTMQSLVVFKLESTQPFSFIPLLATTSETLPAVGERVAALGRVRFKNVGSVAVTEGLVTAVLGGKPWQPTSLLTTASIITSMGGGPLFSLSTGQLLGFCGQHFKQSRTGVTVTAAQPLSAWLTSVRELQQTGALQRGWLGLGSNEPTAEAYKRMGQDTGGAHMARIEPRSPADKAGLKEGDIVLRLDDTAIEESEHLHWLVRNRKPGSTVKLDVLRGTERLVLTAALEPLRQR
jgi:serine protease Do